MQELRIKKSGNRFTDMSVRICTNDSNVNYYLYSYVYTCGYRDIDKYLKELLIWD